MVNIPPYDEEYYEECLEETSRNVEQYFTNLHVLTGFWDYIDTEAEVPCSLEDIEGSIWIDEGKKVSPDISVYEEGQEFVFGELKGTVSDLEIETCLLDLQKYTSDFYPKKDQLDDSEDTPRRPRAVFLITHADHVGKVIERFLREYDQFRIKEIPVCFLSYQIYQGSGGQDKLRVAFEDGDVGDSLLLKQISENGIIQPGTDTPYNVKTLAMYAHSRNFHYYSAMPPDSYTVYRLVQHLDQYRDSGSSTQPKVSSPVSREEVVSTFIDVHSSEHTAPRSSWINRGLAILEDYRWITIDGDTLKIRWEEFKRRREIDDMFQFFAKYACREEAERVYDEERDEETTEREIDESQSELADFQD